MRYRWQRSRYGVALARLLFPNLCLGCQRVIPRGAELTLCDACWTGCSRMEGFACLQCGEFYPEATHAFPSCAHCANTAFHFLHAVSAFRSEGVIMRLIHDFKYHSRIELRHFLARRLEESLSRFERLVEPIDRSWCLVPVPLHPSRERERQYNQSWEMCCEVARRRGLPAQRLLRRVRATRSQATLNREERLRNLRQAFQPAIPSLWRHPPLPKKVLLVDDVMTTGSTVEECAKVLRFDLGIEKVVVITVARG